MLLSSLIAWLRRPHFRTLCTCWVHNEHPTTKSAHCPVHGLPIEDRS